MKAAIDFESASNVVLMNPRMPAQRAARLRGWLVAGAHLRGHVFVLTSGSTAASDADAKWVALSKSAIRAAADGANRHVGATAKDVWFHCLPDFHVGGLGIWARASLCGARVVKAKPGKWAAHAFVDQVAQARATLCSLVPAQVFDLADAGLRAPASLRAIVVGGSAVPATVYRDARALGWPILPSYGMSEAASQIATASIASLAGSRFPAFTVLPHLEVAVDSDGRLRVRGESMLTGLIAAGPDGHARLYDPKEPDGWLATEDFGELTADGLVVLGRARDRIKIGGELANLAALRELLERASGQHAVRGATALIVLPDPRLESVIGLAVEAHVEEATVVAIRHEFDSDVLPFERIRVVKRVPRIPRGELGKIRWGELDALAQEQ